jgi:pyruvate/2-oxoglutarate/acetoin dehydrogenase E1 component/TPP-dependent pyruvate/acetoin dehydrogenase alpha subunit
MVETKVMQNSINGLKTTQTLNKSAKREEILHDFWICCLSREASILARKEVLSGRANFGIIGDGKELAQVAMAKSWKLGDFRSGYYRDQTLMFALGIMTVEEFFAQLYGDPINDPFSGGRQMNCHFATPFIDGQGNFTDHKNRFNISSDISCTGGQMARGLGLAFASKKFRENPSICSDLSDNGNEVAFLTIGDASTSEGVYWETMNAAGVLQVPLAMSVWDDGYGISVPQKYQTTKESISELMAGFQAEDGNGIDIYTAKAWDYEGLCTTYKKGVERCRTIHRPALFHIQEVTQQLGHSTSGDHRRYKSPERLQFEENFDCNRRFSEWIVVENYATQDELDALKLKARQHVQQGAKRAFDAYHSQVVSLKEKVKNQLNFARNEHPDALYLSDLCQELENLHLPLRSDIAKIARKATFAMVGKSSEAKFILKEIVATELEMGKEFFSKHLYSESPKSALKIQVEDAVYPFNPNLKDGYEILNACFDYNFANDATIYAFGEDVGQIGDVNQGLRGMQQKYGIERIFDTGIREWTIMGQGMGMAMRGLRPIAEIQYLDYLLYALPLLSDDLATLRWRSNNLQAAPMIIRTRGHRLVGVWHSGSPMAVMLHSMRGIYLCTPRNMVQASGMYNTLLRGDDPAIVVECLNGYRLKEQLPDNIGTFTVPLGIPEVLRQGSDVTLITYGSCVRIAEDACNLLARHGISVELIDVQTLMPFDLPEICSKSIRKTNRVVFFDEDVPGAATAYMMQEVLEKQGAYQYLDAAPITICAKDHRPAYGNDGDYASKPQTEDVFEVIYNMVREAEPNRLGAL